jgi:hypothetical protein
MPRRSPSAGARQAEYARLCDEGFRRVPLETVVAAMGKPAQTAYERDAKRKPCRSFVASGRTATICERPRCGFDLTAHRAEWRAAERGTMTDPDDPTFDDVPEREEC